MCARYWEYSQASFRTRFHGFFHSAQAGDQHNRRRDSSFQKARQIASLARGLRGLLLPRRSPQHGSVYGDWADSDS